MFAASVARLAFPLFPPERGMISIGMLAFFTPHPSCFKEDAPGPFPDAGSHLKCNGLGEDLS